MATDLDHLRSYLAENRLMTLATVGADGAPWASSVFFAYDDVPRFLFFSNPATQHGRNIAAHPRVAATINEVWGGRGIIRGVQLTGIAEHPAGEEGERAFAVYRQRHGWATRFLTDHVIYQVTPSALWMIDSVRWMSYHRQRIA